MWSRYLSRERIFCSNEYGRNRNCRRYKAHWKCEAIFCWHLQWAFFCWCQRKWSTEFYRSEMCLQQNKKKGQTGFKKNKKNIFQCNLSPFCIVLETERTKWLKKNWKKSNPVQPFNILFCLTGRNTKVHFQNAEVCYGKKIIWFRTGGRQENDRTALCLQRGTVRCAWWTGRNLTEVRAENSMKRQKSYARIVDTAFAMCRIRPVWRKELRIYNVSLQVIRWFLTMISVSGPTEPQVLFTALPVKKHVFRYCSICGQGWI